MKKANPQRYAIVPRSMEPVDFIDEKNAVDAIIAFASHKDLDMGTYFKAVPETHLKSGVKVNDNQWLEAVITTYSYDSPTVYFCESQEEAIKYIKDSMQHELKIDRDNGHDDSLLETLEDELFGMRLVTHRTDGTVDEMCMILAQSVLGKARPADQPKRYKLPQIKRWKKQALCLSADEFDDICVKLYGNEVVTHYAMDGIWIEISDVDTISDADARLAEDLSEYLGLNVTSVHIDDKDNVGVWIVYREVN